MSKRLSGVLAAGGIALIAAVPAEGAVYSRTVEDARDVGRSIDGYSRPDVKSFTIRYDDELGTMTSEWEFHDPVPRTQGGREVWMTASFGVGRASSEGTYCDAYSADGDQRWEVDARRYASGDYVSARVTLQGLNGALSHGGSFSADGRRLTISGTSPEYVRRGITCMSGMYLSYPYLSGSDSVEQFYFRGTAPPVTTEDTTPPTVRWQTPTNESVISGVFSERTPGTTHCRIAATDNVRVAKVEVYIDGELNETQINFPWSCVFDSRTLSDGRHTLRAVAYDHAGNRAAHSIGVTVRNARATPPPPPPPPPPLPPALIPVVVPVNAGTPATPAPVVAATPAAPPVVAVPPPVKVALRAGRAAAVGAPVRLTVVLSRPTTGRVELQRRISGGWVTVARRRTSENRLIFVTRPAKAGRHVFRILSRENGVQVASRPVVVVVRRR